MPTAFRCRRKAWPSSAAEAGKLAQKMGGPVVLKIVSPDILHKTEAGGVLVGVKTPEDAVKGYDTILANAKKYKADAKIVGVQVQQMLGGGQEVIVGAVTDGSFGKLVAFGSAACWSRCSRTSPSAGHRHAAAMRCRCSMASRPPRCSRACAAASR
jgi:acyl-CoA synthetase (NDP forming)